MGSPFWDFSVAVYGSPAVATECLDLQDRFGIDVNLILLCAFLGAVHGVLLAADDISSARSEVGRWHDEAVKPLRVARRNLKTIQLQGADAMHAASTLRSQVKSAELEGERIEQMMLEQWADARLAAWPRGEPRQAVPANLQALLAAYGIAPEQLSAARAMAHIIAAALVRQPAA